MDAQQSKIFKSGGADTCQILQLSFIIGSELLPASRRSFDHDFVSPSIVKTSG